MTTEQKRWLSRRGLLLYAIGLWLLVIVFLSPHAGSGEGRLFFKVAEASPWDEWGDWAAAWCSVKIILLSLGVWSLIAAFETLLKVSNRESLAKAILYLSALPSIGLGLGIYYLVKALL